MNILQKFEAKEAAKLKENAKIGDFSVGDTVKVNVKIAEGDRDRIQVYEGVCISRTGEGLNASFTVRKISLGEGVERVFPLYSPRIEGVELVRRGSVRRAKLYYLRDLRGKSARITERTTGHGMDEEAEVKAAAATVTKTEKAAARKKAKKESKAAAE